MSNVTIFLSHLISLHAQRTKNREGLLVYIVPLDKQRIGRGPCYDWVFSIKSKFLVFSPGSPGRIGSPPRDRRAHEQEKIPRELEEERRHRSDEEEEEWEYEEDMGEEKDKIQRQGERCDHIYTLIRP